VHGRFDETPNVVAKPRLSAVVLKALNLQDHHVFLCNVSHARNPTTGAVCGPTAAGRPLAFVTPESRCEIFTARCPLASGFFIGLIA
jgi:hypothetical protein